MIARLATHRRHARAARIATALASALLASALLACGVPTSAAAVARGDAPARATGPAVAALATADGQTPPVLRVAINQLPSSWGNPFQADGTPNVYVWSAMFDGLTRLGADGVVGPGLALSWQALDERRWRFVLRPGVRFSNGEPFDADAVVATFRWLATREGRAMLMGARFRNVVAATATGPLEVELATARPDPVLPQRLATLAMVAPQAWARLGVRGFALRPEGTGPYRLVDWGQESRVARLVANPGAFRRARLPRLEIYELPETAARVQALVSGDVDLGMVGMDDTDILAARGLRTALAPSMQVMSIGFVTHGRPASPLADVRVRRALNLAVNKAPLAEVLLRGHAMPTGQPASRVTHGHDPSIEPYPYDPEAARRLLAEAGWPRGFRLRVDVVPNAMPSDTLIYQAVAADLRRVGVEVDLRAVTFNEWLRQFVTGNWRADAAGITWNSAAYNDVSRAMENFSCLKPNPYFCEPSLTPLLEAAARTPEPQRGAILRELSRRFHALAPALFLVEQLDLFAYRPEFAGVRLVGRVPAYEEIVPARRTAGSPAPGGGRSQARSSSASRDSGMPARQTAK
jgi:peptide/nickel transport system substrate-binding protein